MKKATTTHGLCLLENWISHYVKLPLSRNNAVVVPLSTSTRGSFTNRSFYLTPRNVVEGKMQVDMLSTRHGFGSLYSAYKNSRDGWVQQLRAVCGSSNSRNTPPTISLSLSLSRAISLSDITAYKYPFDVIECIGWWINVSPMRTSLRQRQPRKA